MPHCAADRGTDILRSASVSQVFALEVDGKPTQIPKRPRSGLGLFRLSRGWAPATMEDRSLYGFDRKRGSPLRATLSSQQVCAVVFAALFQKEAAAHPRPTLWWIRPLQRRRSPARGLCAISGFQLFCLPSSRWPFRGDAATSAGSCPPNPSGSDCRRLWHSARTTTPRPYGRSVDRCHSAS